MASLVFFQGGDWAQDPFDKDPREPKVVVTHATPQLVKFTLTDTDASVANSIRRVMLAEVPTMAVEIVNVDDNDSVLFDEFIAHRMGLMPLACNGVGDIPPDESFGWREHKDCNCFDGCPYCTVELRLDVTNREDRILNVTHFDVIETDTFARENLPEHHRVRPVPFRDPTKDVDQDTLDNGVLLCKLKKDQSLKLICLARKGIPKYHAKFNPTATVTMHYQQIIELNADTVDTLPFDDKVDFVDACPRRVFALEGEKVVIDKLNDCIYCDECIAKSKDLGKLDMVKVKHDQHTFHFTVEAVTDHGPRSVIDVVRAALRIMDWKLQMFLKDTWGDEITDWLPLEPRVGGNC